MELYTEKKTLSEGENTLVVLSFTLPKLKNARRFNGCFDALKSAFSHYAATRLKKEAISAEAKPAGAVINTVVGLENRRAVSLYADVAVSLGGTTRRHRFGITWDKERDTALPFSALFACGKKKLLPLLVAGAERRGKSAAVPLYPDYPRLVSRNFDKNSFYIGPQSAVFFFQSGVLSEKNAPFPIAISKEEISPLMKTLLWTD